MWRCRPVASWWCHWAHRHSPATDHQCSQRWDIKGKEEHFHRKVNEVSTIFTSPLYPTRPQHWLCRPSSLSQAETGTRCLQPAQCTGVWINRHSLTLLPVGTDTQTHDSRQHTETCSQTEHMLIHWHMLFHVTKINTNGHTWTHIKTKNIYGAWRCPWALSALSGVSSWSSSSSRHPIVSSRLLKSVPVSRPVLELTWHYDTMTLWHMTHAVWCSCWGMRSVFTVSSERSHVTCQANPQ